jgi:hypothetical protein
MESTTKIEDQATTKKKMEECVAACKKIEVEAKALKLQVIHLDAAKRFLIVQARLNDCRESTIQTFKEEAKLPYIKMEPQTAASFTSRKKYNQPYKHSRN